MTKTRSVSTRSLLAQLTIDAAAVAGANELAMQVETYLSLMRILGGRGLWQLCHNEQELGSLSYQEWPRERLTNLLIYQFI